MNLIAAIPALRNSKWAVRMAVVGLLGFYVVMALSASLQKGLSFDEGEEIAVGYGIWLRKDFRMEPANGDLIKRWATLPLLLSRPAFPATDDPHWREGKSYELAYAFFFQQGNDPRALLRQCRSMIVVVGVAAGLLVFLCARELFGKVGGLISLTLFVSSSSMLAFGAIVSTEMTVCFTLLGSAWCVWCLLHRVTWGRLAGSLVFVALLFLSKPTAVVTIPLTFTLILIKLVHGKPLIWCLGGRVSIHARAAQAGIFAGLFFLHALFGWAALWTHYEWRYEIVANPAESFTAAATQLADGIDPLSTAFLAWSRQTHFLPRAYIFGLEWLLGHNESQPAFMDGEWKYGGWRTYFPYAMWVKTHPALILLFMVSSVTLWQRRQFNMADRSGAGGAVPLEESVIYRSTPFIALIAVYLCIAVTWDLNIGFRHALPIYPSVYVLAGATSFIWIQRAWIAKAFLACLLCWHMSGPIGIYPHYLAYFSPVVGGPDQGYRRLVDSSLDWGMDLPGLKRWLEVNNPGDREPCYLGYFGVGNPNFYGIKSYRIASQPDWRNKKSFPLGPGIYAISATLLQGIGTPTVGRWNKVFESAYQRILLNVNTLNQAASDPQKLAALLEKKPQAFWEREYATFERLRFGRLCAWLRQHRPPDDNVGHSILIWRLNAAEIVDAGLGPPAELDDAPLHP
jgi:hypothetical protein